MSYSNYRSYLNKRVNKVNCCCEIGPQGPAGSDGSTGMTGPTGSSSINFSIAPNMAFYYGVTGDPVIDISGTSTAIAGMGLTPSTDQILFSDGTQAAPVIAFQSGQNDGIYHPDPSNVAIVVGGERKLLITNDGLGEGSNTINGINVGISGEGVWDPSCGIQRVDSTGVAGWQDGYMGNYERLYFTATDFQLAFGLGAAKYQISAPSQVGGYQTGAIIGEQPVMCTKVIPCGFKLPQTDCSFCIMGHTADGSGSSFSYDISFNWASFDCSFANAGQADVSNVETNTANSVILTDHLTSGTGNTVNPSPNVPSHPQLFITIQVIPTGGPLQQAIYGGWIQIKRG